MASVTVGTLKLNFRFGNTFCKGKKSQKVKLTHINSLISNGKNSVTVIWFFFFKTKKPSEIFSPLILVSTELFFGVDEKH